MPFIFDLPITSGSSLLLSVDVGNSLFVLGANGTGKSSLMQRFYTANVGNARRISAHRQTWFASNTMDMLPSTKRSTEQGISNTDTQPHSRWRDDYSAQRSGLAIYDLIDAQNVRARDITAAVDSGDFEFAKVLSQKDAPLAIINDLLKLSNLPIEVIVQSGEQVIAKKNGGTPYSIAELSDGERNALIIAATVLTVKPGTLLLIDEPERHLHRSIISPLLTQLFSKRSDCAFIISTHDVMLPLDNKTSQTLLVRSCIIIGSNVQSWEADLIPPETEIDEDLKRDILGSRQKILFIEGTEQSLDRPLYSLIFPNISIVPKVSCRDVEHAVLGIRNSDSFHWLKALGIIDNDSRTKTDLEDLKRKGVYALPFFSVESIYYHPEMIWRVTERHATITGENANTLFTSAKEGAIASITPEQKRNLANKVIEKRIREEIFKHLPTKKDIATGNPINISIDIATFLTREYAKIEQIISAGDLLSLVTCYPIRESSVLREIAIKIGFQGREQYENAVRKLLLDNADALTYVQSLFSSLIAEMQPFPNH